MQTEDGDNDRRMQNSQFYERVSQVGLWVHYVTLLFSA